MNEQTITISLNGTHYQSIVIPDTAEQFAGRTALARVNGNTHTVVAVFLNAEEGDRFDRYMHSIASVAGLPCAWTKLEAAA